MRLSERDKRLRLTRNVALLAFAGHEQRAVPDVARI